MGRIPAHVSDGRERSQKLGELPELERRTAAASASLAPELRDELQALLEQSTFVSATGSLAHSPLSEPECLPGTEFGRYVIVGPAGHGGFGRVYAARDKALRRTVAIKVLARAAAGSGGERLIEEAWAASALNHPNILTVYETIDIGGRLGMVTEFVQGESLRKVLQAARGPIPLDQCLNCWRQVTAALQAAHAEGLAHRDVKPENILVRPDGYVKLVDFGLAVSLSAMESRERGLAGTLRYMAPEQGQSAGASPAASDIFSLGLVFYEMLTGVHPFPGETALEAAGAIAAQTPAPPAQKVKGMPAELNRLILAMLEKDPGLRPSAADVAQALAESPRRAATATTKSRWVLLVAAAALAFGGVVAFRAIPNPSPAAVPTAPDPLNIVNVTSLEGFEWGTSFSPDGRQIAFAWDGGPARQPGIYTQPVVGGAAVRISHSPGEDFYPVWSQDGAQIAFVRRVGKGPGLAVMIAPATGAGPARSIATISENEGFAYPVAWHPEGDSLLVRNLDPHGRISILRQPLAGGPATQVTAGSPETWDNGPTPSPSGKLLAFVRAANTNRTDVCVQKTAAAAAEAQCFASSPDVPKGLAWAEGEGRIFIGRSRSLSRLDLASGTETKVSDGPFVYLAGDRLGKRFAYSAVHRDHNIWRIPTDKAPVPEKWISSSDEDSEPAYSPDGQSILFRSERSGALECWISRADGSAARQVTRLRGRRIDSPRWSPNGRQIAFWGNGPDDRFLRIYVADANGGDIRAVTPDDWPATYPVWSADGKALLFVGGKPSGIWSVPAQGNGAAVPLASTAWLDAFLSPDGQSIYFTKGYETPGIWRMPISGAREPELIPGSQAIVNYRYWDVAGDTAYFADIGPETFLRSLDLKTGLTRTLFPLRGQFFLGPRGFAISPDRKSALFVKLDTLIGDIRMIEGLK